MLKPLCSLLINNYNYGRFVGRAVASALLQDYGRTEVIVVDDGSLDGSRAVLESFRDRANIICQANGGQAAAINAAVRASRGEILCFLDADDWWAPEKVTAIVDAFAKDPGAVLAYHRLQPVALDGSAAMKPIPRTLCAGDLSGLMSRSGGWWPFPMTSAVSVRRAAWDEAGDIPARLRISADAWLVGVYPLLGRVASLPDSLGSYRIHQNNWYRDSDDAAMLRRRMQHWRETVELTNAFLDRRGETARLRLDDHLPHRLAAARLDGAGWVERAILLAEALRFSGEPDLLRRWRNAVRESLSLRQLAPDAGLAEASK
jgi:glycosyltransferase involved in cell wall biosynthesis